MVRSPWLSAVVVALSGFALSAGALFGEPPDDLELIKKPAANATSPADTKSSAGDDAATEPSPAEPATRPRSLDDELFERLGGKPATKPQEDGASSHDVVRGMRNAQQRLVERDSSRKTQDIQADIVRQLEKLIEQAKQSKPNPNQPPMPSPQQQKPQPQADPQENNDQSPEPQQADAEQPQESEAQRQARENQAARDSTEETREAQRRESERLRRAAMVNEVWGHLPPAIREKLMNIYGEKYLPKYEDEVRQYFESLAEPQDRRR